MADPRHDWADIIDSINYKARCAYPEDTTAQSSDHWPAKLTLDDDNDIEVCGSRLDACDTNRACTVKQQCSEKKVRASGRARSYC